MKKNIKIEEISKLKMSIAPPKSVVDADFRVIHNKEVKKWVGIGWVTERSAAPEDYESIPEVVD